MRFSFKRVFLSLVVIISLGATSFLGLGILMSQFAQPPKKADVIVVLGGDSGLRIRKGAELYRAGLAGNVILTGVDDNSYRNSHRNWRVRRMTILGVPRESINVDTQSANTWEEACNTVQTMKAKGWTRAIIVSDPPHMLRLYLTWKKVLNGTSMSFTLVPTSPEWWSESLWWQNRTSYRFVLSELHKNVYYFFKYWKE